MYTLYFLTFLSGYDCIYVSLAVYGAAVLEHCLMEEGFPENAKIGKGFNLEELPEKSHGVFYSGDCYVILYTYLKNGRERHIIYFWLVRTLFKTFLNILIAEVLDCQQEWQSVLMV